MESSSSIKNDLTNDFNAENSEKKIGLSSLLSLHDGASSYFVPLWSEMETNERRREVKNWSETEESAIKNQGRTPLSMPVAQSKLNSISGYQKKMKTEYKVKYAVDPNDAPKAELMTLVLKDIARQSNFDWEEGLMFDDGLYIKFGATEIYLDTECVPQMVKLRNVDYKNLIWDYNATRYDLSDALFMAKIEKIYRSDLKKYYPKAIEQSDGETSLVFNGRDKNSYYVGTKINSIDGSNAFDVISVFHHYQRVNRDYYCVVFPDTAGVFGEGLIYEEFKTRKEADSRLKDLNWQYMALDLTPEGAIEIRTKSKLDKYVFTYNMLLEHEETELEEFPFTCFFAIFQKGKFISMMDYLASPQLFYDRVVMQTDYALGKQLKNVYTYNPNLLIDGETEETLQRKASEGGMIGVKDNSQEVIRQIVSQGVPSQYFQMFNFLTAILEDTAGGRSFQGLAEGSSESGKSVIAKTQQGELVAMNYLTNLSQTKKIIGEKLLWWIRHYDTAQRIIKVQGGELSQEMLQLLYQKNIYSQNPYKPTEGFAKINLPDNSLSWLKDAEYELVVTEDQFSESQRDKNLAFSLEAVKVMPEIAQTRKWKEKVLFSLGYSFEDVMAILQEIDQINMMNQQMQLQQQLGSNTRQKK